MRNPGLREKGKINKIERYIDSLTVVLFRVALPVKQELCVFSRFKGLVVCYVLYQELGPSSLPVISKT